MKVAFTRANTNALQSSNLARKREGNRCRMQQQKQNCTKKKKIIQKPTLKNKIQERKEVKSAHGRSTNLGSALVVLFQLTRKRCERARLKQQQETGSKNRQQTGFTQLYVCVCVWWKEE